MGAQTGRENTKRVTPIRDRNGETSKRLYGSSFKELVTNPNGPWCGAPKEAFTNRPMQIVI